MPSGSLHCSNYSLQNLRLLGCLAPPNAKPPFRPLPFHLATSGPWSLMLDYAHTGSGRRLAYLNLMAQNVDGIVIHVGTHDCSFLSRSAERTRKWLTGSPMWVSLLTLWEQMPHQKEKKNNGE